MSSLEPYRNADLTRPFSEKIWYKKIAIFIVHIYNEF
jgi:hypothetical protein